MKKEPSELRLLPLQVGFVCALTAFVISLSICLLNSVGFQVIIQRVAFSIVISFITGGVFSFAGLRIYISMLQQNASQGKKAQSDKDNVFGSAVHQEDPAASEGEAVNDAT